jgi:hypothetical protein
VSGVAKRTPFECIALVLQGGGALGSYQGASPVLWPSPRSNAISYYDVAPLKATLERLVDFDRINKAGEMRLSVGTVNVRTGNSVYFDTKTLWHPEGTQWRRADCFPKLSQLLDAPFRRVAYN